MTALPTVACRKCQKPIIFAAFTKADGAPGTIPLDARAPCYAARPNGDQAFAERAPETFVSHFATCPSAGDFSRKGGTSAADEADDLRRRLATALDEIVKLKEQVARGRKAPPSLFDEAPERT